MSALRIGVVAAGGQGKRIRPRSARVPKVMLPHWEKKLLAAELRAMSELCHTLKFTKRKITPEEQVSDLAVVG